MKFYWNTATLVYLCIVNDCFHATVIHLSSFNRNCTAKPKILIIWLQRVDTTEWLSWTELREQFCGSCTRMLLPSTSPRGSRRRTLILPSMDMSIWPSAHQLRKIWRFSWETWLYILTQLPNPCGALGRRSPAFQSPTAKNKAQTRISIEQLHICIFISASQVIMDKTVPEVLHELRLFSDLSLGKIPWRRQ